MTPLLFYMKRVTSELANYINLGHNTKQACGLACEFFVGEHNQSVYFSALRGIHARISPRYVGASVPKIYRDGVFQSLLAAHQADSVVRLNLSPQAPATLAEIRREHHIYLLEVLRSSARPAKIWRMVRILHTCFSSLPLQSALEALRNPPQDVPRLVVHFVTRPTGPVLIEVGVLFACWSLGLRQLRSANTFRQLGRRILSSTTASRALKIGRRLALTAGATGSHCSIAWTSLNIAMSCKLAGSFATFGEGGASTSVWLATTLRLLLSRAMLEDLELVSRAHGGVKRKNQPWKSLYRSTEGSNVKLTFNASGSGAAAGVWGWGCSAFVATVCPSSRGRRLLSFVAALFGFVSFRFFLLLLAFIFI
ncbi:hypothetical protein GQ600_15067 [Phytophthora cactorum]|nr:hypothetical protein GQ600_15067 [Phytophthora cactorum]